MARYLRFLPYIFLCLSGRVIAQPIDLAVDASDVARHLVHARQTMRVVPGELRLTYPRWIPGNHRPSGPVEDVAGIRVTANGRALTWRRDPVDLYTIGVTVPAGVDTIELAFDLIAPPNNGWGTQFLATLNWYHVLFYPEGKQSDDVQVRASLTVPSDWRFATALPVARESGSTVEFQPAALTTVADSPVIMGRYFRTFDLSPGQSPAHYLHVAADSAAALNASDDKIDKFHNLVKETGALFGSRPYRSYHFLLALSDQVATGGLEHHESSDNKLRENYFLDESLWRNSATLSHEMIHSWNGKFRRPAGLATGDFHDAMEGELLWVYEGLTQYLGELMTARSGLRTERQWRERLAIIAADLSVTNGREWRPLADTATTTGPLRGARSDRQHLRRGQDYYNEGLLIWLEADTIIRRESSGARSLDTFLAAFFGGSNGQPTVKAYTFDDVVAALNAVEPYDWRGFLQTRVYDVAPEAPLGGIRGGGWKLVFGETQPEMVRTAEQVSGGVNQIYSAGWSLNSQGMITEVLLDSPADRAGLAPQMQIVAVNGRQYSAAGIKAAIREAKDTTTPIELITKQGDFYRVFQLDCHTGERFPDLERDSSQPDLLSEISKPRA